MNPAFDSVFARLREILRRQAGALTVRADEAGHYSLEVAFSPKLKKSFPVAWVKIGKSYVSFHFMPIYMFPKLREGLSPKLRARMQGKSCFNFTAADEALLEELESVTARGFAWCRKAGFAPEDKAAGSNRTAVKG